MVNKLLVVSLALFLPVPVLALWQQGVLWQYSTYGAPNSVALSSDGSYVAVGLQTGPDAGRVLFLNRAGSLVWTYTTDRAIGSVAISEDGSFVAAGGYQLVGRGGFYENGAIYYFGREGALLWNYTTPVDPVSNFRPPIFTLMISSDGSRVVADDSYSTLYFDRNGQLLWKYSSSRLGLVHTTTTSNASFVVQADSESGTGANHVLFLDSQGRVLWNSTVVSDVVQGTRMSQDGRFVAVGSGPNGTSGTLYLFNDTGSLLWTRRINSPPLSIAFSSDASTIIIGTNWGVNSFNSQGDLLWNYTQATASSLAVSPDGSFVLAGLWADWQQTILILNHHGSVVWGKPAGTIHQVAVSPDGSYGVVAAGPASTGPFSSNSATIYFLPGPGATTARSGPVYSGPYFLPTLALIPPAGFLPAIPVASVVIVQKRTRSKAGRTQNQVKENAAGEQNGGKSKAPS